MNHRVDQHPESAPFTVRGPVASIEEAAKVLGSYATMRAWSVFTREAVLRDYALFHDVFVDAAIYVKFASSNGTST